MFMLFASFFNHVENVLRQGVNGIVHGNDLGRILVIVVDNGLSCKFRHTHDTVGMIHTILLNTINGGVDMAA